MSFRHFIMALVLLSFRLYLILILNVHHTPTHIFICYIMFPIMRFHYDVMKK